MTTPTADDPGEVWDGFLHDLEEIDYRLDHMPQVML